MFNEVDDQAELIAIGPLPHLPYGWRFQGRGLVYDGEKLDQWVKVLSALAEFEP